MSNCFISVSPDMARNEGRRRWSYTHKPSFQGGSGPCQGAVTVAVGILVTLDRASVQTAAWQALEVVLSS